MVPSCEVQVAVSLSHTRPFAHGLVGTNMPLQDLFSSIGNMHVAVVSGAPAAVVEAAVTRATEAGITVAAKPVPAPVVCASGSVDMSVDISVYI